MQKLYVISIAGKEYFFMADLESSQIVQIDQIVQSFDLEDYNSSDEFIKRILKEVNEKISKSITPLTVSYVFRKQE